MSNPIGRAFRGYIQCSSSIKGFSSGELLLKILPLDEEIRGKVNFIDADLVEKNPKREKKNLSFFLSFDSLADRLSLQDRTCP